LCVNPGHLFLGTRADNNRDRHAKGRDRGPVGESAPSAKLTAEDVRWIRWAHEYAGAPLADLGRAHGVTKQSIWAIVHWKKWAGHKAVRMAA
jgi:hypothetical protein